MTTCALLAAAVNGEPPPAWLFALFPVFFLLIWFGVGTLLGAISGHMALLARFPPVDETCEQTFGMASGRVRGVNFSSALHVGLGARGLHLAANWLFRPILARGIPCIPWSEIRLVSAKPGGLLGLAKGASFEVRALGLPFRLNGEAALAVERKLSSLGLADVPRSGRPLVR